MHPTSNPVLQLRRHCQVPEKNPNVGLMSPSLGLFARPPSALVRTTLPLHRTSPIPFPAWSSVTTYLRPQLENEMIECMEGLIPSSFILFYPFFSKTLILFILLLSPYKKKSPLATHKCRHPNSRGLDY